MSRADRDLVFSSGWAEPVVLAVADRVRRDGVPHHYAWQMHIDAANAVATTRDGFTVTAASGATLSAVVVDAHSERQLSLSPFTVNTSGTLAPVPAHTIVRSAAARDPQDQMDHLAVLAITDANTPAASTASLPCTGCSLGQVTWRDGEILVGSAVHGAPGVASERLQSDGDVVKVSVGSGETMLAAGTTVTVDGLSYVRVDGTPATVAVSGAEVLATGDARNRYRVFAPQDIHAVTVDGAPVAWCRSGDEVRFPCSAPVAVDDVAFTYEDRPVVVDVLANDHDPDGDALSVVDVGAPSHGTATTTSGGGVEYTPTPDYFGDDSFTYTVADDTGKTASATVYITVAAVNDPPVAVHESASVEMNGAAAIPVLDNDTDVDDDELSVAAVTQPAHGSVTVGDDGVVTYTPDRGFAGDDTFSYTADDGHGGPSSATVYVTVERPGRPNAYMTAL